MDDNDPLQEGLVKGLLGFLGVIAAFKFLPRVLSFTVRRFVFGLLSEVIWVVLASLLTEKIARKLTGRDPSPESNDPVGEAFPEP
ncbi:MAG: hypothetical protein BRD30_05850 [Bacteroidetes bacterium QH_2_63_10]|nr:MAG: hypothetical protein BRD30_05850 [Bacteroidetes bacterium QH_2_63_10]